MAFLLDDSHCVSVDLAICFEQEAGDIVSCGAELWCDRSIWPRGHDNPESVFPGRLYDHCTSSSAPVHNNRSSSSSRSSSTQRMSTTSFRSAVLSDPQLRSQFKDLMRQRRLKKGQSVLKKRLQILNATDRQTKVYSHA